MLTINRKFEQQLINSEFNMLIKKIAVVLTTLLVLTSCSDTEVKRDMNDHLSSYLNNNDEVIAFGKAHLNTILQKADYTSVGILNAVVGSQIDKLKTFIDVTGPIYYAAHGPLKKDGTPEKVVLFIRVTNHDELKTYLQSEMSYDLNEANGFTYASSGDMTLGFKQHLAIIIIKGGDSNEVKLLSDAFKRAEGEVSKGRVAELLKAESGDFQMGMSIANLYGTASGDLAKASKSERAELEKLFSDAFVNSTLKFENGRAVLEIKNMFGKELQSKMFLAGNSSAPILKELGSGTPRMGFSINMDVKKMEALMNELSPNAINNKLGAQYMFVKLGTGSKDLNDLWDGKMGVVMFGEPDESGAFTPEINAFLGIKENGRKALASLGETGMSLVQIGTMPPFTIGNNGIAVTSKPASGTQTLKLPKGAENFGKSGISFFLNLEGLNPDDVAEMFSKDELKIILKVAKFISFEYTNEGGKLIITAKDGKENILKQAMNEAVKELSGKMGNNFFI